MAGGGAGMLSRARGAVAPAALGRRAFGRAAAFALALALALFGCRDRGPPPPLAKAASGAGTRDAAAASALYAEARALLDRHLLEDGLAKLEDALAADPRHADSRLLKAWVLWRVARLDEAAEILEALRRDLPSDPRVLRQLALLLVDQARFEEALSALDLLSPEGVREDERLSLARAEALLGAGRIDDAARAAAGILAEDPWASKGYHLLSRIDLRRGLEAQALAWGERYRADEPLRDAEQAALAFERAGDRAAALEIRGRALRARGRWHEAMGLLNEAVRADPGYLPAYLELARLSSDIERPDDAVRALGTLPERPEVLGALGDAHLVAERFEEAAAAYEKAGARDRAARARELSLRGAPDDPLSAARREARLAQRGEPLTRSAAVLLELARRSALSGDRPRARALSLFAAQLAPKDAAGWLAVSELHDRPEDAFVRIGALRKAQGLAGGEEGRRAAGERLHLEWRRVGLEPVELSGR